MSQVIIFSICRYCVEFEILKASKACRKESSYNALKEGNYVALQFIRL